MVLETFDLALDSAQHKTHPSADKPSENEYHGAWFSKFICGASRSKMTDFGKGK
jgi:hypothetical protein